MDETFGHKDMADISSFITNFNKITLENINEKCDVILGKIDRYNGETKDALRIDYFKQYLIQNGYTIPKVRGEGEYNKIGISVERYRELFGTDTYWNLNIFTIIGYLDINQTLLDNPKYIKILYKIIELVWYPLSLSILNWYEFIPSILDAINIKTRPGYAISNCKHGNNHYTCGRGFLYNEEPNKNTRLIFFNSEGDDKPTPDTMYYSQIVQPNLTKKYIKYKTKYITLRNSLQGKI